MKYNYLNWILFNIIVKYKQHNMLKNAIITGSGSGVELSEKDKLEIKPIEKIKMVMT